MTTTPASTRVHDVPVTTTTAANTSILHWPAIIAAVVIGFGFTILLVTIGAAADANALEGAGNNDDGKIAAALGAWTVIAAVAGTLLGSYIGGRYTRWTSRGSAVYHALAAWGLSTALAAWLGASGSVGLLGSSLTSVANAPAKDDAAQAIAWGGWALAAGMALTMVASIAAWLFGSNRHLDNFERK